jgi:hypothetical protein
LEAIARILTKRSPRLNFRDLFAEYCTQSYFLVNSPHPFSAPEIHQRCGERGLTESVRLRSGASVPLHSRIDHLSCHYYRVYAEPGVSCIQVSAKTVQRMPGDPIRVEVVEVSAGLKQGSHFRLSFTPSDRRPLMEAVQRFPVKAGMNYFVVSVVNCGMQGTVLAPPDVRDDSHKYSLLVDAI